MDFSRVHIFVCATGSTLFWKKNAPMATKTIKTISGLITRKSEMPPALSAVSSRLSPRLPKVISEASRTARGRAIGTIESAA